MDEEWSQKAMELVFEHYGLGHLNTGERSMRCPVHDDSHASASVNGSKGVWNCHACGSAGNAIHIVMSRENIEYLEAKKIVEDMVGGKPIAQKSYARKSGSKRWVPPRLRGE